MFQFLVVQLRADCITDMTYNVDLFQFLVVQLRAQFDQYLNGNREVSIPCGTIKRYVCPTCPTDCTWFQFLVVQLRASALQGVGGLNAEFQFLVVQLRAVRGRSMKGFIDQFQFLVVQLRV